MAEAYLIFGLAVALGVAWVVAIGTFIEPEMQRSFWGGDPTPGNEPEPKAGPRRVAQKNSPAPTLGRRTPAHG